MNTDSSNSAAEYNAVGVSKKKSANFDARIFGVTAWGETAEKPLARIKEAYKK